MLSMTNNVISLADWKAKHQRNHGRVQRAQLVPVYVPVRDPDGRWKLELVGHTELDLDIRVDPTNTR